MTSIPDTLVFKALFHEIHEIEPYWSAIDLLRYMCDANRFLAEDCEQYYFVRDDGKITEEEAFLLEWLKNMEKSDGEVLREKLLPVARQLTENRRY